MNLIDEINRTVVPRNWSRTAAILVPLHPHSNDYTAAESKMRVNIHTIKIKEIARVENPFLYGSFKLRVEESKRRYEGVSQVMTLLHDTAEKNIDSIVNYNLDWRMARRCKYGAGVSFSTEADYAIKYSNLRNGENRAMIITDVAVGLSCNVQTSCVYPPNGYDTTMSNNMKVIVKYNDDEFYPKYVVYYDLVKRHYNIHHKGQRI